MSSPTPLPAIPPPLAPKIPPPRSIWTRDGNQRPIQCFRCAVELGWTFRIDAETASCTSIETSVHRSPNTSLSRHSLDTRPSHRFLDSLLDCLRHSVSVSLDSVLDAAIRRPGHGYLLALQYCTTDKCTVAVPCAVARDVVVQAMGVVDNVLSVLSGRSQSAG